MKINIFEKNHLCKITFFTIFFIFSTSLNASKLNTKPVISIGVLANGWAPFQISDGLTHSGFSVDLIKLISAKLGYEIIWKIYPNWPSLHASICRGEVDLLLDTLYTEARECLTFTQPYYSYPSVIVVRNDSPLFHDIRQLLHARVAVERGIVTKKNIETYYPDAHSILVNDTEVALHLVINGNADAYIGNMHAANLFLKNNPDLVVVAQSPFMMEHLYFGVAKGNPELTAQINKALQALSMEEQRELAHKWLGGGTIEFLGQNSFLLRPDERDWLSTQPPIVTGLDPKWSPFSFYDDAGKASGLVSEYLSIFKDKLGLAYELHEFNSWDNLQQALFHHEVDMTLIPQRVIERLSGWQASQPIVSLPIVVVTSRDNALISNFSDLENKHLIVADSMLIPELKNYFKMLKVTKSLNAKEGLSIIAGGHADAYIGNLAVIQRMIENEYYDRLYIVATTPIKDDIAVAVRNTYAPLLPLINRVLASMSDKEKQQIRNTWLAVSYNEGIPWQKLMRTLIPVSAGITLFILVLSIAYWRLRREILRRRQVELALARAKESAEFAASKKAEFLATMSHEIRTPMNGIVGMAEQLSFTPLDLEQRQMVAIINQGAEGLLQLIGNVLDYSKLDAGKMGLAPTSFLLRELIDNVLTMISSEVQRKGLQCYLHADDEVGARFCGDVLRLKQVLFNLVSNAIKFTERGFIELSIRLEGQADGGQQLLLGVQDTGIGMSAEVQARVFNAFEQADGATTRSYGGTGLGLSISHTLAELMGGELTLESAPGLGTFIGLSVTLPLEQQREHDPVLAGLRAFVIQADGKLLHTLCQHLLSLGVQISDDPQMADLVFGDVVDQSGNQICVAPLGNALGYQWREGRFWLNSNPLTCYAVREVCYRQLGWGEQLLPDHLAVELAIAPLPSRLLVVEDHHLNQALVLRQLKQLNLVCDLAKNGQQALTMLAQHSYDLVLCDCQMPVMDGYEFTRRVRVAEKGKRLLIIAMTANVLPEQATRCFAAGMDDLLGKPVLQDALRQMLQKWQILPPPTLIDVVAMAAFFGQGDKLRQMFPLFRQELEQSMAQEPLDDNGLANWVHRQAGTISMMMAPQLAEQAWQLEEQIRQFGSPACTDELTRFRAQLQQIIGELTLLSERDGHSVIEGELE